jgi:hypothetical protein
MSHARQIGSAAFPGPDSAFALLRVVVKGKIELPTFRFSGRTHPEVAALHASSFSRARPKPRPQSAVGGHVNGSGDPGARPD